MMTMGNLAMRKAVHNLPATFLLLPVSMCSTTMVLKPLKKDGKLLKKLALKS